MLKDPSEDITVRNQAIRSLGRIKADVTNVLPALVAVLSAGDEDTRWYAAEALGELEDETHYAVSVLSDVLKTDPNEAVREQALKSVWNLKSREGDEGDLILTLAHTLKDESSNVRQRALIMLLDKVIKSNAATPQLLEALHDPHFNVRRLAALALRSVEPVSQDVISSLVNVYRNDNEEMVRNVAAESLKALGIEVSTATP